MVKENNGNKKQKAENTQKREGEAEQKHSCGMKRQEDVQSWVDTVAQ